MACRDPVQTLTNFQVEDPTTSGVLVIIALASAIVASLVVVTMSSCYQTYRWYVMKKRRVLIDQITQPMFNAPSEYKGSEYK